ncbi:hypothetical protein [Enterobacter phage 01_vB_Eclo_IJM]|nr:hypothetical protein [Enterobacter phage 01_vB_Eclo_IJM]
MEAEAEDTIDGTACGLVWGLGQGERRQGHRL